VAEDADVQWYETIILQSANRQLHNASSVKSIFGEVDKAVAILNGFGRLRAEIQSVAHASKYRAAQYRSQRKLDDADACSASGNNGRAEKLRREAAVLLAQDMKAAFPNE